MSLPDQLSIIYRHFLGPVLLFLFNESYRRKYHFKTLCENVLFCYKLEITNASGNNYLYQSHFACVSLMYNFDVP